MALVVEDGTGKPDAESYCSVSDADKYFADRGVTEWASRAAEQKEIALRKATDYIELRFSDKFIGFKATKGQALSFPRYTVPEVPRALLRACAEYALRSGVGSLVADPTVDSTGLVVKSKTEKLGPMEEKVEYATTSADMFRPYPAADLLLQPLLRRAGIIR